MIKDCNVLRGMAKAGHIKLPAEFGKKVRHWTGQMVKVCYVDSGDSMSFEHNGKKYEVRYLDGCFNPFVFAAHEPSPAFV